MNTQNELLEISKRLSRQAEIGFSEDEMESIERLKNAVDQVETAFSGSWLGYHANVYYQDFVTPPDGDHFDSQWGLKDRFLSGTSDYWHQYSKEEVENAIYNMAGNPDLEKIHESVKKLPSVFDENKAEILSIFQVETSVFSDNFLTSLEEKIQNLRIMSKYEIVDRLTPKGIVNTVDHIAFNQGSRTPPHVKISADIVRINKSRALLIELSKLAKTAGLHIARTQTKRKKHELIGTNIFIGHGHSSVWKDLKDFVQDRLALPYDEFNRVPVAGTTNITRLSEMLDSAAIAFIILTGEDEQADGSLHARLNAVHEAGLFQGRLGFNKAIVLLEDDCEEFSNIHGLGQIRFPKDNISAIFEEIRRVLEREQIIEDSTK